MNGEITVGRVLGVISIIVTSVLLGIFGQDLILPAGSARIVDRQSAVPENGQPIEYEMELDALVEQQPAPVKIKLLTFDLTVIDCLPPAQFQYETDKVVITTHITPFLTSEPNFKLTCILGSKSRSDYKSKIVFNIPVQVGPSFLHRLSIGGPIFLVTITFMLSTWWWIAERKRQIEEKNDELKKAEEEAKSSTKAKFAWDAARIRLDGYVLQNLQQVNQIFVVAVGVMVVGFAFIVLGLLLHQNEGKGAYAGLASASAGVITEFIGATFMVIYRSTMAQANEFMSVLERINSVGMAVQVLDSIADEEKTLKNGTRARIVELLLLTNVRSRTTDNELKKETENKKEPK
jgi:hypothetical protein